MHVLSSLEQASENILNESLILKLLQIKYAQLQNSYVLIPEMKGTLIDMSDSLNPFELFKGT